MTYEAWRVSFQSSEQAARAAYKLLASRDAKIAELVAALDVQLAAKPPTKTDNPMEFTKKTSAFNLACAASRMVLAKVRKP